MKRPTHVLTTRTVTYAMMAQRALSEAGIPSRVTRPSDARRARGCAYGLEIDSRDIAAARSALERSRIPFSV